MPVNEQGGKFTSLNPFLRRRLLSSEKSQWADIAKLTHLQKGLSQRNLHPKKQVDSAFNRGTKLIYDLLFDDRIDTETANIILSQFIELYVEYKLNSEISTLIERLEVKNYLALLKAHLEE